MDSAQVTRRPQTERDQEFLFDLYASTREAELDVLPWGEGARREFTMRQYQARQTSWRAIPNAAFDVVEVDWHPMGQVITAARAGGLHIVNLEILAAHRGNGIGTVVLSQVLTDAEQSGGPVTLYVDVGSPARRLYERLGFRAVTEDAVRVFMERPMQPYAAGLGRAATGSSQPPA